MNPRPQEEIDQQIADLKAIKPRVRRCSIFGDDHHAAIDAQIEVLISKITSHDRVYDMADLMRVPDNVRTAMLEARDWLVGELQDYKDLVESWEELT